MGFIRPATPGFIVTLTATVLLAVVSFCVPYFKSVFFLKANLTAGGQSGSITFGTLGYCVELSNGTTCSKPSVGYELDINSLVGNRLPIEIPQVVVKWLTYALVLHIVALGLSAGSAVFGLLAHVREMSMTCCSTCVSGFAAVVALLAFIFDLALFFLAKARINKVPGGSAEIGNAIWLTLAAWVLLFFSGCFYTLGRCCISKRKPRGDWDKNKDLGESGSNFGGGGYAEQMRLDAVKAEADRKARQNATEVGLPAFHETLPLTGTVDGDTVHVDAPYQDHYNTGSSGYGGRPAQGGGYTGGGYAQAPPGTRAVDEYYSPSGNNNAGSTYPPQRQASAHTAYAPSSYASSTYGANTVPPVPNTQYPLAATNPYAPDRYGSPAHEYGHTAGGTTYHSTGSHQQYPTGYSLHDPYESPQQRAVEPSFTPETYNSTGYASNPTTYYSPQSTPGQQPERSYTLGGGYGGSSVPPLNDHHDASYFPYPGETRGSPAPLNTNVGVTSPTNTSPVKGPRAQRTVSPQEYDDRPPPGYDAGSGSTTGAWGKN